MIAERIENGDGDGIDGDVVIEGSGGFGSLDDADDVAIACTEVVIGDKRRLGRKRRRCGAGRIVACGIEWIAHEPAASFEGGVLDAQGDPADDLGDAHCVKGNLRLEIGNS